ncbi:ZIP family metal transporter [Burkholderia cepacia]|uniref:ZIP family metal transporter n=1 Tax=Burkholderia cepacia TaxID=292 RepID=UPI001CF40CD9|nr:ZIP family metal transporter [Burkholderia cepacia]MCA8348495.1 ZIP family metal transporter [Burkholderia cepacia]
MPLMIIIVATLGAGVGSVWVADLLTVRARVAGNDDGDAQQRLLSLATGALLATAFTHLLPEAFESKVNVQGLFLTLLVGLVFFFLLSKVELWHHERDHADHHHRSAGWSLLIGDSVHSFGDGLLIASALVADTRVGVVAAISVLVHEIPHHMGDLVVLRQGSRRGSALLKVSMAGSMTASGGIVGYFLASQLQTWQPFFVTVAGSSFIYVALSNLIPQLQQRQSTRETWLQVVWLILGIALVVLVGGMAHE